MKKSNLLLTALLVGVLGLSACNKLEAAKTYTTAQMVDIFAKEMTKANPDQPVTPEMRKQMEESLNIQKAIADAAIKDGLDKTDDAKVMLKVQEYSTLAKLYMDTKMEAYTPTDADLQKVLDEKMASMPEEQKKVMSGNFYHFRHILVKSEAEANAIIAKLKAGEKFETLAQASLDGSKAKGGDLGWAPLEQYVPAFSSAAAALKVNEVTQKPVKTQFGFHVIEAMDEPKPAAQALKPQLTEFAKQNYLKTLEDGFKTAAAPAAVPKVEEKK